MENENSDAQIESTSSKYTTLFVLLGCVVLAQIIFGFAIYFWHAQWTERGQFGDMFGAVNTLFSGMAFAGVIYTIYLQRHELELQRYELKLTRTELNRSATAQEKSEQALSEQVKALNRQAEALYFSARPIVTARVTTFDGGELGIALNIVVENTGNRPAKNIKLSVEPKVLETMIVAPVGEPLRKEVESCFSERGIIPVLANGKSLTNGFGWLSDDSESTWKLKSRFDVEISYQDLDGAEYTNKG